MMPFMMISLRYPFLSKIIFCQTIQFASRNMKKRNEDDSNNQEKHSEELSAEDLKELNRLLERLHQADYKILGKIEIHIYKPGSQHVDHVDNQYFYGDACPKPKKQEDVLGPPKLPPQLSTDQAMVLWKKAQDADYVDANYQPLISRTQAALLADAMAKRLGIKEKWKVFETLWNRKNMYRDYYKALNLQQSLAFQDEIKRVFH